MMRRLLMGLMMCGMVVAGCDGDIVVLGDVPAAPRALDASYHAGVVTVTWELASAWNGESFRVYSRRITDPDYFLIAEVTNCAAGLCSYEDVNVVAGQTYEYYVSAFDPVSGIETATDFSVEVAVPFASPPPVPNAVVAIALDGANYITWGNASRGADDFSHYRVYLDDGSTFGLILGETDSEGFLDLLALNGDTYAYFVTAVDVDGHESAESSVATGTPRPDFSGEWVYSHFDQPSLSGFRFSPDEADNPIRAGTSVDRHFRLEEDEFGWWLVPGPQAAVYPVGFETTALKCGVAADAGCKDLISAPTSGYGTADLLITAQSTYVLRVVGDDGLSHYGVIRVVMLGFDQDGSALMIFDWAYQLQAGNPDLISSVGG